MTIDVERARADTPGCEHVVHLNNAGAALPPRQVHDAIVGHLWAEATTGGYEAAEAVEPALERVYDSAATLLNCDRDEIAVVENATRAWDMAFYGMRFDPGDRILTSASEYASNYIAFLQMAGRTGAVVEPIPDDEHGQISVDALAAAVDDRVKLISLTHVPTNGGLVNPAVEVGKVAQAAGVPYLLDACQSVGQLVVDVDEIGCDILSTTGRKWLRGPRATGLLYVRRSFLDRIEPPFLDLHAATWVDTDRYEIRPDARRFENWETNVATKLGLGVAIDYALSLGLPAIAERVDALAGRLRGQLGDLDGVRVLDLGTERCGLVTFEVAGVDPEEIKRRLLDQRINVSVSDRASTLLDMRRRGLDLIVRASVHYYNTEDELDRFVAALTALTAAAR